MVNDFKSLPVSEGGVRPSRPGLHEVPVLIRDLADGDAMAAALVENLQRQDLNANEEADGYKRLIEEFWAYAGTIGRGCR